jgi:tetrahydromethanopterin S-methyltransferase subunit G
MDTINIDNKPTDPSRTTEKFLLSDIQTRLAIVEHSQAISKEERKEIKEYLVKIDEKLDKTNESVAHYKGKLGGIILAVSAVGTALAMFWDHILRWMKG